MFCRKDKFGEPCHIHLVFELYQLWGQPQILGLQRILDNEGFQKHLVLFVKRRRLQVLFHHVWFTYILRQQRRAISSSHWIHFISDLEL